MRWAQAQVGLPDRDANPFHIRLAKLREARKVQTTPGVWDQDAYNMGLANGLILSETIMEGGRDAPLLSAPERWLNEEKAS